MTPFPMARLWHVPFGLPLVCISHRQHADCGVPWDMEVCSVEIQATPLP